MLVLRLFEMSDAEARTKLWIEAWKHAAPVLARDRLRQLRATSTPEALARLEGCFESVRLLRPPRPSSGLVQQQAWLHRKRRS